MLSYLEYSAAHRKGVVFFGKEINENLFRVAP